MIRIGIVGISEGNGHPYSWSAIFNGYDREKMSKCPFPVIPKYLANQAYPEDFLSHRGLVTHIWTTDIAVSRHIAECSFIENIVEKREDMIGKVDAVILARDDAENHFEMALPFIHSGLSIFIDKPLAISLDGMRRILREERFANQIFSCSTLRYAQELNFQPDRPIEFLVAQTPKKWARYSPHIIEPSLGLIPQRGNIKVARKFVSGSLIGIAVEWENVSGFFYATGRDNSPIRILVHTQNSCTDLHFRNSFECFRSALNNFVDIVDGRGQPIPREETEEVIRLIETGI